MTEKEEMTLGEYTYAYRLKLLSEELEKLAEAADRYVAQLIDEGNCPICLIERANCRHTNREQQLTVVNPVYSLSEPLVKALTCNFDMFGMNEDE